MTMGEADEGRDRERAWMCVGAGHLLAWKAKLEVSMELGGNYEMRRRGRGAVGEAMCAGHLTWKVTL